MEKEEKTKKQEKPKRAPQKKNNKTEPVKKAIIEPMAHIDDFLRVASDRYELNNMRQAGFKAYMNGKHYMADMESFVPYLERYLGK